MTFKVGFSTAASNCRIRQVFRDNAVNERTTSHWFQKFRSGDLFLCDEPCSGRPHVLNGEALKAAIEEATVKLVVSLPNASRFLMKYSRLHLHRIGKMYKVSKWVPHTLSELRSQQVTTCFSLLSWHHNILLFDRVFILK